VRCKCGHEMTWYEKEEDETEIREIWYCRTCKEWVSYRRYIEHYVKQIVASGTRREKVDMEVDDGNISNIQPSRSHLV